MRSFECDFEKTQDSSFKHYETKAELEHMKQEYSALTEAYLKLEKENISNYSQIQSMRLALDCHSSYQVNKEIDLNIRISELEKALDCLRLDKASSSSKFLGQLNAKETYIEHLLTTLLNLHQKIEYCKDDLSKTQKDYHKQQKTLESETSLRETLENLYTKSLCEIEEFKQNLTTITKEYKETKHLSETIATTLKSDYEHEQNEEISLLTKNYESKLLMLTSSYNLKLSTQERSHKEMINSVSKYMNIRIESIKNYYETRITKMIQDYSFQEAKFHSKLADLSLLYSNMRDMCKQIEEELLGKSSFIHIVTEERKELIRQKKELDSYLEKISFEHKLSLSSTQKEMEIMRERLSEKQKELKEEYEKKVNFISTNKSLSVEGIRAKYERELQKVSKSSSENSAKLEKFHESQCLTMLEELAKLESEKTDLSIRLDCQIKEIQNDAEYRYMNYERKLKQSREEIVKELEKDHTNTVQLLKLQIFEQSKRYQLEISEIEDQVEKKYKDIIKNIKAQFEKEKNEIHMENLKMVAEIQDLCKKKIVHVENQLAAIKQNFVNEGDLLRQKLEKKDVEINGLHAELGKLNKDFIAAGNLISSLKVEKKRLENEFALIIDSKSNFFEERENELYEKFETDQKNALAKVYGEKAEMEKSMEKALQSANDRFDALSIRFKLLENKKRDIYQREINQTVLRLAQEITEKNKYIDNLCKELAKIKVQLKYTGDTMRIFTMEKVVTATHKKSISENFSTVHRQRPSSVGPNKTFKF